MNFTADRLQKNVQLSNFVTFKLGGPAEYFFEAKNINELVAAIDFATKQKIPWFVLGGGSNLVVSDHGIDGLVIKNSCKDRLEIDAQNHILDVSAGYDLGELVKMAYKSSLSGAESFTGIPGSVGGAIYGNAGAYGRSIGEILLNAEVLFPDGSVKTVDNSFFDFDYRTSILKRCRHIVLSASFQLKAGKSEKILERMKDIMAQRRSKHPDHSVGCAGSFFKNLPPLPGEARRRAAGAVLEKAGAKSMSIGGASVFHKHANFIINTGNATSEDVKKLAQLLKEKVMHDFGIELNEEVKYIGKHA
jgi:UDP-N-acetylmuramate dehydrogenase